jgi:hypothetical protein
MFKLCCNERPQLIDYARTAKTVQNGPDETGRHSRGAEVRPCAAIRVLFNRINHLYFFIHMAKKFKKEDKGNDKLVRDSFTIPAGEYEAIDELKKRYLDSGVHMKKSEILRAGLIALSSMDIDELKSVAERVERIKPGRPKKSG